MSTRYVWERYKISYTYEEKSSLGRITSISSTTGTAYSSYTQSASTGKYSGTGSSKSIYTNSTVNANQYPYLFISSEPGVMYVGDYPGLCNWVSDSYRRDIQLFTVGNVSDSIGIDKYWYEAVPEKGSLQGYVSSKSSSVYPQDGVSGSYWYDYRGSDNIDPTACSIPSTIMGGTAINITVTPGSGKVYEGTVQYEYQVKLGTGNWTTIATTSATSYSYTVPYGTTTMQTRVRAKDNIGFTSADYFTSSSVTVINNKLPTAPGSIEVTNVFQGQQATITITAATDPDGTVESYIYERSVDGSMFTQIANVNALSQTDQVSADWGTVAYRACAVDNDGYTGPYVTSETTTVNSGWIIISGPTSDMGDKPAPFNFIFTPNVTSQTGVTDISVVVTLDGEEIYNDTPDAGQEVSIYIDTRLMITGKHTIQILATKEDFLEANGTYTFNIPSIALPDGGIAEMLQNSKGEAVFPYTLARLVIGKDGKDLNELLEGLLKSAAKIQTGTYTGTGTAGSSNPNSLTFNFEPKLVFIYSVQTQLEDTTQHIRHAFYVYGGQMMITDSYQGTGGSNRVTINGNTMSWYNNNASANAALQLNTSGAQYAYGAIG